MNFQKMTIFKVPVIFDNENFNACAPQARAAKHDIFLELNLTPDTSDQQQRVYTYTRFNRNSQKVLYRSTLMGGGGGRGGPVSGLNQRQRK